MTDTPRSNIGNHSPATAVVGLQWGDEGKGKAVDLLAKSHDAVVRYNGGANAGHSVVVGGTRHSLHLIPSGILYPGKLAVIGNGVVVDPWKLIDEIDGLARKGIDTSGLVISDRAHAVLPYHKLEDALREDLLKRIGADRAPGTSDEGESGRVSEIGTTRRGIGPAYADKAQRACAVRMGDLLRPGVLEDRLRLALALKGPVFRELSSEAPPALERLLEDSLAAGRRLAPMIKDTTHLLHDALDAGKRILFEGANGTLLDVDHGTYPFVTGSNCGTAGIASGTGVPAQRLGSVIGVMKAYTTRVGGGPMPTELKSETGDRIRNRGREFGTTTGRPRRVGWLDMVALRFSCRINGTTSLALTMLDVLAGFPEIQVCTAYDTPQGRTDRFTPDAFSLDAARPVFRSFPGFAEEIGGCRRIADLPAQARAYLDFISESLSLPFELVSVGPDREQTMFPGR